MNAIRTVAAVASLFATAAFAQTERCAGGDGWVGAGQQARIQSMENRQSNRIFAAKHR